MIVTITNIGHVTHAKHESFKIKSVENEKVITGEKDDGEEKRG